MGHRSELPASGNITPEQAMDDLLEGVLAAQPDLDAIVAAADEATADVLEWVEGWESPGLSGT
ncbi:hypothetical protein [Rhodococcus sp. 1163]|uniref:hypothetical protein n=1 Tax=Rhodococcus sp. 1163 TaxID=1905289 RepID=UPI0015C44228|nr:hypothetical protein [Rhodococcus sp. 1163]